MENLKIDLSVTGLRNRMINDYLEGKPTLNSLFSWPPAWLSFAELIESRKKFPIDRNILAQELDTQHQEYYEQYAQLKNQVDLLRKETTFTVTTGHQLCLAGGPLFFLYKIITTINLAKGLKARFKDHDFIPVFWLASEDHDFEEINKVTILGNSITWSKPDNGATGRLSTASLLPLLEEIKSALGENVYTGELMNIFNEAYSKHTNLADATRSLALSLFAKEGLLVIDADRPNLKKVFSKVIREELSTQFTFEKVTAVNASLEKSYTLPVTPRPLNLFYLDQGLRERIVKTPEGDFEVVNTDLRFSHNFILDLAASQPERFSPNVILRPVYQEMILPNLAYIGGPAEASYWLQFKSVFDHLEVFYPMVVPRSHALILNTKQLSKFKSLGFNVEDLFSTTDDLINRFLKTLSDQPSSFEAERESLNTIFTAIKVKLSALDPTLEGSVQAELQRSLNGLDNVEKKMNAALKRKHETAVNLIRTTVEKVKPDNQPQERVLNFSNYYAKSGSAFIDELLINLQPFDEHLNILLEN
ncbi:bacillithiol biosynthesis cysteine-adding enzyme BshC [soil metagenome]